MKAWIVSIVLAIAAVLSFQYARLERARLSDVKDELALTKDALEVAQRRNNEYSKIIAANAASERLRKKGALVAQKELNNAIKAEPDWADSTVPDSVWDALTRGSPRPD